MRLGVHGARCAEHAERYEGGPEREMIRTAVSNPSFAPATKLSAEFLSFWGLLWVFLAVEWRITVALDPNSR